MGVLADQAIQPGVHREEGVQQIGKDKTQTQQLDGLMFLKGLRDKADPILDWFQGKPSSPDLGFRSEQG